jgi:hypothetical protein
MQRSLFWQTVSLTLDAPALLILLVFDLVRVVRRRQAVPAQ